MSTNHAEKELLLFSFVFLGMNLASMFLFFFTGLKDVDFLELSDVSGSFGLVFSPGFIAFTIFFPMVFALIGLLAHYREKEFIYKTAFAGAIPATIAGIFIGGFEFAGIFVGGVYLFALFIAIEAAYIKKDELKHLVTFRGAAFSARQALAIVAIGLFIVTIVDGIENQDMYVERFGEKVMSIALGDASKQNNPAESAAGALVDAQQQMVEAIVQLDSFKKMRDKTDSDVQSFVLTLDALEERFATGEIKRQAIEKLGEGNKNSAITFDLIREQSPLINSIAENYWLLNAFTVLFAFLFYSNIIVSNLAGFYAAFLRKVFEFFTKA